MKPLTPVANLKQIFTNNFFSAQIKTRCSFTVFVKIPLVHLHSTLRRLTRWAGAGSLMALIPLVYMELCAIGKLCNFAFKESLFF